jgi:RNA polymerase sigma-70 factor (ECF subfamily)
MIKIRPIVASMINPLSSCTDLQLVVEYQQHKDPMAFAELYRRFYPKVLPYCVKKLLDQEAARDTTQDVFLKAATHLDSLRNPAAFTAWIFRIAHNDCVNYCKNCRRKVSLGDETLERWPDNPPDHEALWRHERRLEAVEAAMNSLAPSIREMLHLKYMQGYAIHDLENHFHLSGSAVKMRLARARRAIERRCQFSELH